LVLYLLILTVYGDALPMSVNDIEDVKFTLVEKFKREILRRAFEFVLSLASFDNCFIFEIILEIAIISALRIKKIDKNYVLFPNHRIDQGPNAIRVYLLNWRNIY
jgi:hypothetical protein